MPITLLRPLLLRLTSSFRSDKSDVRLVTSLTEGTLTRQQKGVPEGGIEVRREVRYQSFRLSIEDAERHKEGDV